LIYRRTSNWHWTS